MAVITILGLDPGLRSTGYAVAEVDAVTSRMRNVVALGVSETQRSQHRTVRRTSDDLARAQVQAAVLRGLVETFDVNLVAYELSTTTPYKLPTFSFGVMLGIVASLRPPIVQVLPQEVKKAVAGSRSATKEDVIRWAVSATKGSRVTWPTSSRSNKNGIMWKGKYVTLAAEHPADALASIQAAIETEQFRIACSITGS